MQILKVAVGFHSLDAILYFRSSIRTDISLFIVFMVSIYDISLMQTLFFPIEDIWNEEVQQEKMFFHFIR